jgi:hypothetical protein
MASKEASTFYTHQTNLRDISQPTAILQSLVKPLVLRIPQEKGLQPLIVVSWLVGALASKGRVLPHCIASFLLCRGTLALV